MNTELFERNFDYLNCILTKDLNFLEPQEIRYRLKRLKKVYDCMQENHIIEDCYYSYSHEIKAIHLFSKMDYMRTRVYLDSRSEPGVDLEFKGNLIECVICTTGKDKNFEEMKKSGYQVIGKTYDYNEKFRQITLRVLSALNSKRLKYEEDLKKGIISDTKPYCIFLNLGSLSQEWFPGKNINEATRFLVGRGFPKLTYDNNSGNQVGGITYSYVPIVKNNNSSDVVTNFFGDSLNAGISAIIITTAELNEHYSHKNTVVFTNPFAKNKLQVNHFKNFTYWKVNNDNQYIPRVNGKRINN